MNLQSVILNIGDYVLLATAVPLALFIVYYRRKSNWKLYSVGRTIMSLVRSLFLYVLVVSATLFLGTGYFGREWIRLAAYSIVFVAAWRLFVTLRRIQKRTAEVESELEGLENPHLADRPEPESKEKA